jgi:hypothetical protein
LEFKLVLVYYYYLIFRLNYCFEVSDMSVRILVGENEDVKELAKEFPEEASVIEEMLKVAESGSDTDTDTDTKDNERESVDA